MTKGFVYAGVFYLALCLSVRACAANLCAEDGQSTMDPRLEHAMKIRIRVPVREPDGTIAPQTAAVSDDAIDGLWDDIRPVPREKGTTKPRQLQARREAVKHAVKKYGKGR